MENEKKWYVMYAPNGFGKPINLYRLEKRLKSIDVDFSYPCIEIDDGHKNYSIKPLFNDYVFIRCVWNPNIEFVAQECVGKTLFVLKTERVIKEGKKSVIQKVPVEITEEELTRVYGVASNMESDADYCQELLTSLKVDDHVRFVRGVLKDFVGRIVKVVSASLVVVEMTILGRQLELTTKIGYIEKA